MKTTLLFIAIMMIAFVAILAMKKGKKNGTSSTERPKRKRLLTEREEAMFNRLKGALPDANVLAQVSFGALLSAKSRPIRNTFDRKIADFVVCDKAMQVIGIVELDDASHKSKEIADQTRDALLESAGYRVLRYKNIPDITQVQRDLKQLNETTGVLNANHHEPAGTSPIDSTGAVLARKTESQSKRTA